MNSTGSSVLRTSTMVISVQQIRIPGTYVYRVLMLFVIVHLPPVVALYTNSSSTTHLSIFFFITNRIL